MHIYTEPLKTLQTALDLFLELCFFPDQSEDALTTGVVLLKYNI